MKQLSIVLLTLLAGAGVAPAQEPAETVFWQGWSTEAFAQARREHKLVLLDLQAVWCHWCHVMDATTYRDPRVVSLLGDRFVTVKVDQDARPDLASRYEDYGWPATIIYEPDGTEIVKKRGYIEPNAMVRLLIAVMADPTPVEYRDTVTAEPVAGGELTDERRAALVRQWMEGYDSRAGGWGFDHKYLDWDTVEFALREARRLPRAEAMARATLGLQRKLLDPAWGGMYQYSADGDWNEPHFEKIMSVQAEDMRIYALAYAQWGDPAYLETAQAIHRYLRSFLTGPEGAFYVSQDADLVPGRHGGDYFSLDDAGRRARGIPRIDRNLYSRENGWAIAGLAQLAAVSGDVSARAEAETAAGWVLAHRALPGGGFRHDRADEAGPYLGDTLAMGRGFYGLYQLTGDPAWLDRASAAVDFIRAHFGRGTEAGYATSDTTVRSFPRPRPEFDENVALARLAAAVGRATGRPVYHDMAVTALRWLLEPALTDRRGYYVGGVLLAAEEAGTDPLHIMILGRKGDPAAQALHAAALRAPTGHKLVEWWDRGEGAPPRGEDIYPDLPRAAAFLCANGACSAPVFDPQALAARIKAALK
jgi:uncharacterized protein YyaL (SSP411 family)